MSIYPWIENRVAALDLPIVTLEVRRILRGKWGIKLILAATAAGSIAMICVFILWLGDLRSHMLTKFDPETFSIVVAGFLVAVKLIAVFVVMPVYSSRVISEVREMGGFPMLAIIPMQSKKMILQYFYLGLAPSIIITLITLPAVFVPVIIEADKIDGNVFSSLQFVTLSVLIYPIAGALYTAIGILCSCMCSKASSASTASSGSTFIATVLLVMAYIKLKESTQLSNLIRPVFMPALPVLIITLISIGITALLIYLSSLRFEHLRRTA